jgi:hypothetical protein
MGCSEDRGHADGHSTVDHLDPADEVGENRDRPHPSLRKKDDCLSVDLGVYGTAAA